MLFVAPYRKENMKIQIKEIIKQKKKKVQRFYQEAKEIQNQPDSENRILSFNRLIAKKEIIKKLLISIDIVLLICTNYLINSLAAAMQGNLFGDSGILKLLRIFPQPNSIRWFWWLYLIMPYGITACGGNFIFNLFHSDEKRTHYNAIVAGLMGAGKSTLLKKVMEDEASRGDYIRSFDVSGEFTDLTYALGGKVLNLDGKDGMVNPLEIFKADEEEQNNYPIHISKLITLYRFFKPYAETEELYAYQQVLDELYEHFGIKAKTGNKENQITGLPVESYPIYQDLLDFLEKKISDMTSKEYGDIEKELIVKELLLLNSVKKTISTIISTYGSVLNGYTSIRISDEQIVTFNVSSLKKMSNSIFQAVTPTMERGECYIAISGVQTYQVQIEVSQEELALFAGGV